MTDDRRMSPAMRYIVHNLYTYNLTIKAFRDRRGRLRHVLRNNEVVPHQTVEALLEMGMIELVETPEEAATADEVHYRLRVKP